MELFIYLFLVAIILASYVFFIMYENPFFPTIIIVLSLCGLLLSIYSPAYIKTGELEDYNYNGSGSGSGSDVLDQKVITPITQEFSLLNTIFTLFFMMTFILTILEWVLSNKTQSDWYR